MDIAVVINGVTYVPVGEAAVGTDGEVTQNVYKAGAGAERAALNVVMGPNDAGDDDITIRDYLRVLLETLWDEGESFSGKRPLGNSGWEYDLYGPLVKAGFIQGRIDEDGYVDEIYREGDAREFVRKVIAAAFEEPKHLFTISRCNDEYTKILLDGEIIGSVDYTSFGWDGMESVDEMIVSISKKLNIPIKRLSGE